MVRQETDPNRCPPGGRETNKLRPPPPAPVATQYSRMVAQGRRLHPGHRVPGNAAEMATAGSWLCGRESVGRQANACSLYCSEEISQPRSAHMKPTGLELLRYATERGRDVIVPCSSSGPSWPARSLSKGSDRSETCWSAPGMRDISLGSAGDEKK